MLELAIAEAYRPRPRPQLPAAARQPTVPLRPPTAAPQRPATTVPPRPASFATNPNARASFSSSRPRAPSVPSRNASVASHSRSFISFISRRGRPGSVYSSSDRTITSYNAVRADSVFSQATASRAPNASTTSRKDVEESPKPSQKAVACNLSAQSLPRQTYTRPPSSPILCSPPATGRNDTP